MNKMEIKNKVIDGNGMKKYFWYIYFEILNFIYKKVIITNCTIQRFHIKHKYELKFQLARLIYKNI